MDTWIEVCRECRQEGRRGEGPYPGGESTCDGCGYHGPHSVKHEKLLRATVTPRASLRVVARHPHGKRGGKFVLRAIGQWNGFRWHILLRRGGIK